MTQTGGRLCSGARETLRVAIPILSCSGLFYMKMKFLAMHFMRCHLRIGWAICPSVQSGTGQQSWRRRYDFRNMLRSDTSPGCTRLRIAPLSAGYDRCFMTAANGASHCRKSEQTLYELVAGQIVTVRGDWLRDQPRIEAGGNDRPVGSPCTA